MKIGLFLVGSKGQQVLENLVDDFNIEFVMSYNDKNTFDDSFYLMKGICLGKKIRFYEGKTLPEEAYMFVDKIFVIGWQFLLKDHLDKLIVIHDSMLPEYKGWSPTVQYLIDGSNYLGATAFAPTMKMDTGDIYAQAHEFIEYPIKIEKAIEVVGNIYLKLIKKIVEENPTPQEMEGEESFCIWRDYNDYFLDWNLSAEKLKRTVDAIGYPFAGAKFWHENKEITVLEAEIVEDIFLNGREKHVGKFWSLQDGLPTVVCWNGLLKLTKMIDSLGNEFRFKKLKTRL